MKRLPPSILALALATSAHAALWTPTEITTLSWYDASNAGSITATGSGVTAMADLSGNNHNLTVGVDSAGRRPTTGVHTINGLNVLTFDNSSGYQALFDRTTGDATPTGINAKEFYAVVQYTSLTSNRPTIIGDVNATNYALQLTDNDTNGTPEGFLGGGFFQNGSTTSGGPATNLASPTLIRRDADINNWEISLGSDRTQNTRSHNGYIAEVIIVDTELSFDDRERVEGYLAWKWGLETLLPGTHTYSGAAPVIPEPSAILLSALGSILLLRRKRR